MPGSTPISGTSVTDTAEERSSTKTDLVARQRQFVPAARGSAINRRWVTLEVELGNVAHAASDSSSPR